MKKPLLFSFGILLVCSLHLVAQQLQMAPLNPVFLDYQKNPSAYSYVPSPLMPVKSDNANRTMGALPASYDMRDSGWVSSIKNQCSSGWCGSCWTHSCMSNLESLNLRDDGAAFDFSEQNLNTCHWPFDSPPCMGGSFYISSAYLLAARGPYLESQDPYTGPNNDTCTKLVVPPVEYITDAWLLPTNDRNVVKQGILDYGSMDVSFYYTYDAIRTSDSTFFFNKKYTFNTPKASLDTSGFGQWHEVSLIGWDDSKVTAASQPGAWLIKNSIVSSYYGDLTESAANLWVSYYDSVAWQSIGNWPKKMPFDTTAIFHHYDEAGWCSSFGYNDPDADYAIVKFVAPSDEKLKFLTTAATYTNMTVTFDVYDNFNGTTLSGLLGSISAQNCPFAGYYSFNLPSPITITKGNDFYIKVSYSNPTPSNIYRLPIEGAYSGYSSTTPIETGKCWVSGKGTSWSAIGGGTSNPYDICIKAYGVATNTTGVIEASKHHIELYPNPATSLLNISFGDHAARNLVVHNIAGQDVLRQQVNSEVTSVDISKLSAGIYFISIQSASGVETFRFIRQE